MLSSLYNHTVITFVVSANTFICSWKTAKDVYVAQTETPYPASVHCTLNTARGTLRRIMVMLECATSCLRVFHLRDVSRVAFQKLDEYSAHIWRRIRKQSINLLKHNAIVSFLCNNNILTDIIKCPQLSTTCITLLLYYKCEIY